MRCSFDVCLSDVCRLMCVGCCSLMWIECCVSLCVVGCCYFLLHVVDCCLVRLLVVVWCCALFVMRGLVRLVVGCRCPLMLMVVCVVYVRW